MFQPTRHFDIAFTVRNIPALLELTQDHLAKLVASNINGRFDDLLTETGNLFEEAGGIASTEQVAITIARIRSKEEHLERIYAEAGRLSATLHGCAAHDEFFPGGVCEIRRSFQREIKGDLDRILAAAERHNHPDKATWEALRSKWHSLYLDPAAVPRPEVLALLQQQLASNLLRLAAQWLGQTGNADPAVRLALTTAMPDHGIEPAGKTVRDGSDAAPARITIPTNRASGEKPCSDEAVLSA